MTVIDGAFCVGLACDKQMWDVFNQHARWSWDYGRL